MNNASNESLLKQHIVLEKEKKLFPEFIILIEHKQENIRKILEGKGLIIVLGITILSIMYTLYNPPTELAIEIITPLFR